MAKTMYRAMPTTITGTTIRSIMITAMPISVMITVMTNTNNYINDVNDDWIGKYGHTNYANAMTASATDYNIDDYDFNHN